MFPGYTNSDIPVRLTKFCSEEATLEEMKYATDSSSVLSAFRNMKAGEMIRQLKFWQDRNFATNVFHSSFKLAGSFCLITKEST